MESSITVEYNGTSGLLFDLDDIIEYQPISDECCINVSSDRLFIFFPKEDLQKYLLENDPAFSCFVKKSEKGLVLNTSESNAVSNDNKTYHGTTQNSRK